MKRSGEYVSNLSGEAAYKSFRPSPLPPEIEMDAEMIELLTLLQNRFLFLIQCQHIFPI